MCFLSRRIVKCWCIMRKLWVIGILGMLASPVFAQTPANSFTPTQTPTITPTGTRTATRTIPPTKTRTSTATALSATSTPTGAPATSTPVNTVTATATLTPVLSQVDHGQAGCAALSDTPTEIGSSTKRMSLAYWAATGPIWCGYNTSINKTPGPTSGAKYATSQGLVRCKSQDLKLYCLGNGGTVCWDEVIEATPTPTPTP